MKVRKMAVNGHQWMRNAVWQVLMAIVALLCMVLASGAGWQWY